MGIGGSGDWKEFRTRGYELIRSQDMSTKIHVFLHLTPGPPGIQRGEPIGSHGWAPEAWGLWAPHIEMRATLVFRKTTAFSILLLKKSIKSDMKLFKTIEIG